LATLLQRPVVFEDASFRLLGYASLDQPVDSARLDSIAQAQTSPSIIGALQHAGVFDQIRASGRPVRVPPFPELGMTMERIAAPINVDGETLAYVWIIAGDRPLEDLDRRAIERAATVAALIMLRDKEVRAAEQRMRESFMHRLLSGAADDVCALADQATRLGLDADCPHQMIVLQLDVPPPAALSNLSYRLDQTARQQSRACVTCRGDHLVAICECGNARDATALAKHLIEELDDIDVPARVGIGRACGSLAELHVSYRQAKDALRIGRVFAPKERVLEFDSLGLLYWLDQLPDDVIPLNTYAESVETLVEADAVHSVDLRHTLEVYLDAGGCVKEAARGLFIHRNTVYHRLHRIQSICGLDLKDPLVRLNLHVALKNYRLHAAS
jgi:purine catabolism regulator